MQHTLVKYSISFNIKIITSSTGLVANIKTYTSFSLKLQSTSPTLTCIFLFQMLVTYANNKAVITEAVQNAQHEQRQVCGSCFVEESLINFFQNLGYL